MSRLILPEHRREELVMHMHSEGYFGIKEDPNDFMTLKSGRRSPHYFDIRQGLSSPRTRQGIAQGMVDLTVLKTGSMSARLREHYNHIVGSPEAMTSYAAIIADLMGMSLLQPRVNRAKVTGNKSPILGRYNEGDTIGAYDDVVTDGATKIETIEELAQHGLVVKDYYVVLDREEGGSLEVEAATGLAITPALGLANSVRILRVNNAITETQFDNVVAYMSEYGDSHAIAELAA